MKLVESSIIAKAENIFFQSFDSVFKTESILKIFKSDIFKNLFKDNIKLHLSGNVQYRPRNGFGTGKVRQPTPAPCGRYRLIFRSGI